MRQPLRVLLVEDCEDDAVLILRHIRQHYDLIEHRRVDSSANLIGALNEQPWDIVISDYRMPRFSGMTALAIVRTRYPNLPFILVSAVIEPMVGSLAKVTGANDYLMKSDIHRLMPSMRRALSQAAEVA